MNDISRNLIWIWFELKFNWRKIRHKLMHKTLQISSSLLSFMIELVKKEKKLWTKHVFKRHISIPFKEMFLIWNYLKNDLWNLKMFSLNQFWWIIIIWINSLHNHNNNNNNNNNNNIVIIIMIYCLCVIPTNVGQ